MTDQEKENVAKRFGWAHSHVGINRDTSERATPSECPLNKLTMIPIADRMELAFMAGLNYREIHAWHDAHGDYLPDIGREVIVMCHDFEDDTVHLRVSIAYRPGPEGWDGKNIATGEVTHYDVKTYGKGGWNQDKVKYWLDMPLPNEEE
ncbi:MAG: hypothetical protein IJV24_07285 [Prevotella sp.]|nr:hypothetical protein [Prevotella sp.]